jgi:ribosomal protein S12 methylthiotransferase accessory factor YcaO
MFVRRKVVKEKHYFQVVENHRVGGRVRQVILASLGAWPSVAAAQAAIPERLQELERLITANRELQSEADSRRPWPRYTRSGQTNWKLVHQRACQDMRRVRREITRLTSLLQDIQELEQGVTQ